MQIECDIFSAIFFLNNQMSKQKPLIGLIPFLFFINFTNSIISFERRVVQTINKN